jgi:beta-N-acetylhexosaminidase
MSFEQLAGQRVIYSYAGYTPPASLLAVIRAGEVGGVILFSPNIADRAQIRSVIYGLQAAALASPVHRRLLILTDQEGGEIRRIPGAPALSEKQIGQSSDPSGAAGTAGREAGVNLNGIGVNVNLAPVLDVYRIPGNFIDQYQRSYSSNPTAVTQLGAAFIRAQQPTGVAATAKHFPGLGAATQSQNTDAGPVTLDLALPALRGVDEAPYRAAIAAGVKLIMSSWAIYPALDPTRPAGLSPLILRHELRDRLNFRGVTITDGIDAGAVTPYGSLAHRSFLAAAAGEDLILAIAKNPYNNTPLQGISVLHALTAALVTHQLSLGAARQAAAQLLRFRADP